MTSINITSLLQGLHNVRDHNARGDGNADDYNAFVLANAAANGRGIIYVPPGTYRLDTGFSPSSGVTLILSAGVILTGSGPLTAGSGAIVDFRGGLRTRRFARKQTVTGVAPSATANTWGTVTDISPSSGYYGLELLHIALTSGGTFGAETLTVRVTATFSDATTQSVTKTFTATGGSTSLTNAELADLLKNVVAITRLDISAQSTIASSTATGGAVFAGWNT